ncbi:unnamed protein product [Linum trigynum]|uniref:Uncharacterized protein n=1 Tax=Linum trigynum TaxID=586398 RepID=A0AAV2ESP2_9ROSI
MEVGSQEEKPRRWGPEGPMWEHVMQIHNVMDVRYKSWTAEDLQEASGLPAMEVERCIKRLLEIEEIVEVNSPDYEPRGDTQYMNAYFAEEEFNPFFEFWRKHCLGIIDSQEVVSLERITHLLRVSARTGLSLQMPEQSVKELLIDPLVLRNGVIEVVSNGMGEFASIPAGQLCYKRPA